MGLQTLSDDLSTLQYRTRGGQKAPVIIRTRGHRLEGIWHSGSPMGTLINSLRGIHILVPRNFVESVWNVMALFISDEPGIIIEAFNFKTEGKSPNKSFRNKGRVRLSINFERRIGYFNCNIWIYV